MSAFRILGPALVCFSACGGATKEPGETERGNASTSTPETDPSEVDASTPSDAPETDDAPATDDDAPTTDDTPTTDGTPTTDDPPVATNPPATAPVIDPPPMPTSEVGAACVASNSMRGVRIADEPFPEFPAARCVDLSTSGTLPEYVVDQDWQAQVLMRASDFGTADGPWQLERIAGTDVLATNALGEQALLAFAQYTGICYFDQAGEQGLQVRAVFESRVLACDGERCIVANMPSPGTLNLDELLIELPDEGYDRLFHAEPYNLSLSNGEKVVQLCGGIYFDEVGDGWRAPYLVETEVALEDYLLPVRERCSPDTLFFSDVIEEPYPRTLFGLKDGKGFFFTDRPEDMSFEQLETPRCQPVGEGLDVVDGAVVGFFAGPHLAKMLTSFLTSSELRGHVFSIGIR